MQQRNLTLALLLSAGVLLLFSWLFPPPAPAPEEAADDAVAVEAPAPTPAPRTALPEAAPPEPEAGVPARTVAVRSPLYEYRLSTRGARLERAELLRYDSYVEEGAHVQLVPAAAGGVLGLRLATGGDTVDLSRLPFRADAESVVLEEGDGPRTVAFAYGGSGGLGVELAYTFHPDRYLIEVRGRLTGAPAGAELLADLGPGLAPHDAPEHGAEREMAAVGWNTAEEEVESLPLRKIEGEPDRSLAGPLTWAGIKDRYFFLSLISEERPFAGVHVHDLPDVEYLDEASGETRESPRAQATVAVPVGDDGAFAYDAYLGPLEHGRLAAAGHQLEEVNPYGYAWLRPVIRPIAAVILWVLRELHDNLGVAYGWVLVLFGVMMRLLTWPLNAKAMRAQMRNMEVQPVLQARMKEIQNRHGDDPRKQQEEMFKLYQELGVNPFSMLSGCLPMLIPMPVLITLFFVFQKAVEFRGVSFLWLPDLSLRDPLYLLPVFLVGSMFTLQLISTRLSGMEQNPQTKMMMYVMPVMMGVLFFNLSSGLNLYYATTNIASLPQQLLIARERRRVREAQKAPPPSEPSSSRKKARRRG